MGTPLEYLALGGIATMLHFRYTYTRSNREGEVIERDTGPISGHTQKSVKLTIVKRFRLQGTGGSWTSLVNGTHKRSHRCPRTGERSTLTLESIPEP